MHTVSISMLAAILGLRCWSDYSRREWTNSGIPFP
jgi:hypothetical protein